MCVRDASASGESAREGGGHGGDHGELSSEGGGHGGNHGELSSEGGGAEKAGAAVGGGAAEEGAAVGGGADAVGAATEGCTANKEETPVVDGGATGAAGAAVDRNALTVNGRGENTPCAISSSRLAALEAASGAAVTETSAIDFSVLNESGGTVESVPNTRGGTIDVRGPLYDAIPESGGVRPAGCSSTRAPDDSRIGGAGVDADGGRSANAVRESSCTSVLASDCGAVSVGHPKQCETMRICGFSCLGHEANSQRNSSANASAAQQERMCRQQSATSSRCPELDSDSACTASRNSTIAYSYSARSVSGSFAKCERMKSRVEVQPALAISRLNCARVRE